MNPDKKVSFGFNKINKKTFVQSRRVEQDKVELIDCVEEQFIKIKDAPKVVEVEPLVIPIRNNKKDLLDRIAGFKQKESPNKHVQENDRPDSELTIDELAARELINDAKNRLSNTEPSKSKLVLPFKDGEGTTEEEKEPTLDDYEKIPVGDFGMAMLRGMGWKEGMGIGKSSSKLEPTKEPELRPKGLGLGASRIIKSEIPNNPVSDKDGNTLILKKGTYAKIIAGSHKGDYCEVQGLDEEAGRVIVKTSLLGQVLTVNEFLIIAVTKEEYVKNSKVLNNAKYEEYKKISDKNLENYQKLKGMRSDEEVGSESTIKIESSIKISKKETLKKDEGEHSKGSRNNETVKKNYEKVDNTYYSDKRHANSKNRYKDKHTRDYSSDDTDSEINKRKEKESYSRERNKYYKEKSNHMRTSSDYQEKNRHQSRSTHDRSSSSNRDSDKYNKKNKR